MTPAYWTALGLALIGIDVAGAGATAFVSLISGSAMLAVACLVWAGWLSLVWQQCAAVVALATLGLVGVRRPLAGHMRKPKAASPDEWAGVVCETREGLGAGETGHVLLRGTLWQAHNASSTPLAANAACVVRRVEGITLWVEALPPPPSHFVSGESL